MHCSLSYPILSLCVDETCEQTRKRSRKSPRGMPPGGGTETDEDVAWVEPVEVVEVDMDVVDE